MIAKQTQPAATKPKRRRSGPNHPQAPKMALAKQREADALALRMRGRTYRQIGDELGCGHTAAHEAVGRALAALSMSVAEKAEEVRALELDRLDAALAAIWPRVERGDDGAIRSMLAIQQRRASLLGLDRVDPTPLPPPGPHVPSDAAVKRTPAFVVMTQAEADAIRAEKAAQAAAEADAP